MNSPLHSLVLGIWQTFSFVIHLQKSVKKYWLPYCWWAEELMGGKGEQQYFKWCITNIHLEHSLMAIVKADNINWSDYVRIYVQSQCCIIKHLANLCPWFLGCNLKVLGISWVIKHFVIYGGSLGLYIYTWFMLRKWLRMGAGHAGKTNHVIKVLGHWGGWYQPNLWVGERG